MPEYLAPGVYVEELSIQPKSIEAYRPALPGSTMTQADIDQGRLICVVGVAVVRPAEFVIFRIGQWTADRPPSHHKRRRRSARRGAR